MESDGRLRVEFRLWDVYAEQQLTGLQFFTTPDNWRRIAHLISDAIYKRLTGEDGYFDTRVVYVSETGPKNNRVKRLTIMDQDGHNPRMLTNGRELVLTPRFSPNSQEITYLAYRNNAPRVYVLDIETGQQEVVGEFPGMTFAPRFSPDGQKIIMSLQRGGNADIYTMDLRSRQVTRLTNTAAIDTSPSYSPDGRQIAFEIRSWRFAADLCDERRRFQPAAHQLRSRELCDARLVAAWRPDFLYQDFERTFRDRRDAPGRHRRSCADRGLSQ